MTGSGRGRPRSEAVHRAVLSATCALLEEVGYERLSIKGVAARAGVGKQTVYRRWAGKSALVTEAVLTGPLAVPDQTVGDTGDLRADLLTWLQALVDLLGQEATASLVRATASAAADDAGAAEELCARFTGPLHATLVDRLAAGVAVGQIRPGVDLSAVADALIGAPLYRVLARAEPVTTSATEGLLDALLEGLSPLPPAVPAASSPPAPRAGPAPP